MPFRAKVRSVFGGKKSTGDLTTPVSDRSPRRTDIEYYKPGQLPPSKYPGHWNEKHQRKLHAFSFQAASRDRKGSIPSSHSPGGSIAQSRRSSWASRVRQSLGGRDDEDLNPARSKSHGSHVGQIVEGAEDEADVGNVGLSGPTPAGQRNLEQAHKLRMNHALEHSDMKLETNQVLTPEDLSKAVAAATLQSDR